MIWTQTEAAVDSEPVQDTAIEMTVLCRSPAQVAAALEVEGVTEIAVDFLEVHSGGKNRFHSVRRASRTILMQVFLPKSSLLIALSLRYIRSSRTRVSVSRVQIDVVSWLSHAFKLFCGVLGTGSPQQRDVLVCFFIPAGFDCSVASCSPQ